jgi:hypothetical protein
MEQIRKGRSFGFLVSFLSCGVIIAFDESVRAEGMRSITRHLLRALQHGAQLPDAMLYDTACALKIHWDKWRNTELLKHSPLTTQLPAFLAIDRFHQPNHRRPICKTLMNPDHDVHQGRFQNINSQVAEQNFKYLARSKASLRCFNFPSSFIILLLISHHRNCKKTSLNFKAHGLAAKYFNDLLRDTYQSSPLFSDMLPPLNQATTTSSNIIDSTISERTHAPV